jgi:hypothetical protein
MPHRNPLKMTSRGLAFHKSMHSHQERVADRRAAPKTKEITLQKPVQLTALSPKGRTADGASGDVSWVAIDH